MWEQHLPKRRLGNLSPLPLIEDIEKNVWADGGAAWRN